MANVIRDINRLAGLLLVATFVTWPAEAVDPAQPEQAPAPTTTVATTSPPANPIRLECSVQGDPVELPDDVYIRNIGTQSIARGTKVAWQAKGTELKGVYTVPVELTPGAGTFAHGVVPGGLDAGHECACSIASATTARASRPVAPLRPVQLYTLRCVVEGTPPEFPDDINVTNNGKSTVRRGKVLHWTIPGTTRQGDHTLGADLPAGKSLILPSVVTGGLGAGTPCTVTVK